MLYFDLPGSDLAIKMHRRSEAKAQIVYWQDMLHTLQQRSSDMDSEWRAAKTRNANAMLRHWHSKLARDCAAHGARMC